MTVCGAETDRRPLRAAIIVAPHEGPGARVAPLGAMAVAAYAERELGGAAAIDVFDCDGRDPDGDAVLSVLAETGVSVVGFQMFSSQVAVVLDWAKRCRVRLPNAVLVAGGHHPTLTWAEFVHRHGAIFDAVVKGDGEEPFTEILRRVQARVSLTDPPIPSVGWLDGDGRSTLPPEAHPIDMDQVGNMLTANVVGRNEPLIFSDMASGGKRRAVAMTSSRSCPLQCSFCSIITMPGKWRANDSATVVDWLKQAYSTEPFEHVYFMDANFFVVPRRVREIAHDLAATFPGVTWSASSTVRMLLRMEDDMGDLVASGLRMVELGIESGSARQLAILNKEVTIEENLRAAALLQAHRLQIGLDFIMFFPDQTVEDLRDNLRFLDRAGLLLERGWDHYVNTLELYPGTPLRSVYARRLGLEFDNDVLPVSDELFFDPAVRNIHRNFVGRFVPAWSEQIDTTYGRLLGASQLIRRSDPTASSRLLLEAVALRRMPFKLLWSLTERPEADLENAAPWLDKARERMDEAEAMVQAALLTVEVAA